MSDQNILPQDLHWLEESLLVANISKSAPD